MAHSAGFARLPPEWVGLRETHIGVVFFVGDRAYKLKKPVAFGFVDFRDLHRREVACHREVELNRRLAPDVYDGVADLVGPDGAVCEHLVVMRRMPEQRRLETLVRHDEPLADTVRGIAETLARFHRDAARGEALENEGTRDAIRRRWHDSFAEIAPHRRVVGTTVAERVEELSDTYLAGREPLFADRIAEGRIVDGHGDLLSEDIFCLDDGPRILDCLEFDDRLRAVDGLDDVAFLAMDLERLGAPELAALLLDTYVTASADPAPASLRHHFVAYRAFVRAKVACLRHAQGDPRAADLAHEHASLALAHLREGVVRLILVGGLPGTGKSTLSEAIAHRLGATVFTSDRVRKELAGLEATESGAAEFERGIYSPDHTERTYAELLRRSEGRLARGETVVLDASWISTAHREAAAALAARTDSGLEQLECWAPPATMARRLRERSGAVSDATPEIAQRLTDRLNPWPESHRVLTAGSVEGSLTQALAHLRE